LLANPAMEIKGARNYTDITVVPVYANSVIFFYIASDCSNFMNSGDILTAVCFAALYLLQIVR
jgi:hypothetical protein